MELGFVKISINVSFRIFLNMTYMPWKCFKWQVWNQLCFIVETLRIWSKIYTWMSSTYEMYWNFRLPLETFAKNICHIKDKVNETLVLIVTKPIFHILEYGIFRNMAYFGICNTKYFGICKILASIIWHIFGNCRNMNVTNLKNHVF